VVNLEHTLVGWGIKGTQWIRTAVLKVSATGDTADSIKYFLDFKKGVYILQYIGRAFFSALETGRGPRKSEEETGYRHDMLRYMQARGIGADLSPKKREQLARFLVLKINKEGDETYKKGGRIVYTPVLEKIVKDLTEQVAEQFTRATVTRLKNAFNDNQADK
jgi:hypothetical protein